jgi:hypothetical protein
MIRWLKRVLGYIRDCPFCERGWRGSLKCHVCAGSGEL